MFKSTKCLLLWAYRSGCKLQAWTWCEILIPRCYLLGTWILRAVILFRNGEGNSSQRIGCKGMILVSIDSQMRWRLYLYPVDTNSYTEMQIIRAHAYVSARQVMMVKKSLLSASSRKQSSVWRSCLCYGSCVWNSSDTFWAPLFPPPINCSLLIVGDVTTWLILPVVICLSQRLSHACLSISFYTAKLRMAH